MMTVVRRQASLAQDISKVQLAEAERSAPRKYVFSVQIVFPVLGYSQS